MRLRSRSAAVAVLLTALILAGIPVPAREGALSDAVELFDRQAYGEARRALEGLPEADRKTGPALYYSGRLDLIDGDHERAAKRFEEAIDVAPGQSEYHHWLAVAIMRRMPYASFISRMTGSMKALRDLRKAIELDPDNLPARATLFQMMVRSYDMGAASRENLVEQAQSIARIDSVMGYVARGTLYQFVDDDLEVAGAAFENALDLAPTNRAAAISYADYLWEISKRDEAILVLAAFVERVPDDKPAHFNLGTRIILRGIDYAGAKNLFERCLPLKSETGMPSEPAVRWCLGLACHLLDEEDRARSEWATVYRLDEDFDSILEVVPEMSELNSILCEEK